MAFGVTPGVRTFLRTATSVIRTLFTSDRLVLGGTDFGSDVLNVDAGSVTASAMGVRGVSTFYGRLQLSCSFDSTHPSRLIIPQSGAPHMTCVGVGQLAIYMKGNYLVIASTCVNGQNRYLYVEIGGSCTWTTSVTGPA